MLFEAFHVGERKLFTTCKELVPDVNTLLQMKAVGYTFRLDGKRYVPTGKPVPTPKPR